MKRDLSLFKEEKKCANCLYAQKQDENLLLLCEKKGAVKADHLCKHYSLDINSRTERRRHLHKIKSINPADFSLD